MRRRYRQSDIHGVNTLANSHHHFLPGETIARALAPFGLQPSAALADAVREYVKLLLRWNRKISLTAVHAPEQILQRHFGESMFAAQAVPISGGRLIDVGSGAGFPGLALKMVIPELEVMLIEANLKKAAFLGEVVRTLELTGVEIETHRVADLKQIRNAANFVTCRAVRPDKQLLAWMRGALKSGAKIVLWLGEADAATVRARSAWRWQNPIAIPLSSHRVLQIGEAD